MEIALRRPCAEDLAAYQQIRNSPYVMQYNCMSPLDEEEAKQYLAQAMADPRCFFIDCGGRMIGAIYFSQDTMRYKVNALTVSYYLAEASAGRGYMTQALSMALDAVFAEGVELVSARVFSENRASIQLLKRLGFQQEGYLRHAVRGYGHVIHDDTLWALFREDSAAAQEGRESSKEDSQSAERVRTVW